MRQMTQALLSNARCSLNVAIVGIYYSLKTVTSHTGMVPFNSNFFDTARTDGACHEP